MWVHAEGSERPDNVDSTSSKSYVYVRNNIVVVEATEDVPEHYEWDELEIPKSSWEIWETAEGNSDAIAEIAELSSDNEIGISDLADAFAEYVEYNESKE